MDKTDSMRVSVGLIDPQWQSIINAEKSETATAEHNIPLDRWQCEKETRRLGIGRGGEWKEGGKVGREGGNISGQLPTLTLRRSYEFLYYYCFYSVRIFLFTFCSKKECFKIIQHFICAILRFLWRFKLFIARNKSLSSFYLSYF